MIVFGSSLADKFKDICFKIIGYPDWFKQRKEKQAAKLADGLDNTEPTKSSMNNVNKEYLTTTITNIIQQELMRAMKSKSVHEANQEYLISLVCYMSHQ